MERVLKDQRGLLQKYVNKDVTAIPQAFIPYKEVLDIYNAGLQVPDDVTLIWCDDNYGYIRHFPTAEERARKEATVFITMYLTGAVLTIIFGWELSALIYSINK